MPHQTSPPKSFRRSLQAGIYILAHRYLKTLAAIATFAVITVVADRLNHRLYLDELRDVVRSDLAVIKARLEGIIGANMHAVQGLAVVIGSNPALDQAQFQRAARSLFDMHVQLRNITAAPDLVVRMAYPLKGNEALIGLDFLADPQRREAALRARDSGAMVLAGPIDLIQGGKGFIGRIPVNVDDGTGQRRFWGLVSCVIEVDHLYTAAGISQSSLDIAIRGKDGLGAQGEVFAGAADLFEQRPVVFPVALPGTGQWLIAATPRGGWPVRARNAWLLRLGLLMASLIVVGAVAAREREYWRREDQEQRLKALFTLSPIGIALNDVETGQFLEANDALLESLDYSRDELLTKNMQDMTPPEYAAQEADQILQLKQHGRFGPYEKEYLSKNGRRIAFWVSGQRVHDRSGRDLMWSIMQDISVRKATEHELENHRHQLQQRNAELHAAKDSAESAARAKGEFLAVMSHEIRTPLNGVLGMLRLVQKTARDDEQQYRLEIAKTSADSLLHLINDILDFSKIEAGRLDLEAVAFDVIHLLDETVRSLALRAQEKGLELILDTTAISQAQVIGDPVRLRQIVVNLLGNAIKFTQEGEIVIRCNQQIDGYATQLTTSVSDTGIGIGIAEENIASLFQAFSQGDAGTTRKYGGTGLGLAICRRLCELMGGEITAQSGFGTGSCFTFSVALPSAGIQEQPSESVDLQDMSILVADANLTVASVVHRVLAGAGATVVTAATADSALDLGERRAAETPGGKYDIAIIDSRLDKTLGLALATKIVRTEWGTQCRFIFTTGIAEQDNFRAHAALGRFAIVTKPLLARDLLTQVVAITSNAPEQNGTAALKRPRRAAAGASSIAPRWPSNTRLLLVEDNPVNQLVAKSMLADVGLVADLAVSGDEALEALRSCLKTNRYTAVLMDCEMPGMDGFTASRAIRDGEAGEENRHVPIIALTAAALKGDRERCIAAGMNDYLTKPLEPDVLLATLKRWLPQEVPVNQFGVTTQGDAMKIAVWDPEAALVRLRGRSDRLYQLVALFLKGLPHQRQALADAFESKDIPCIAHVAHTLMGSLSQLHTTVAQTLATELVHAAREGNLARCLELGTGLDSTLEILQRTLHDFVGASSSIARQ